MITREQLEIGKTYTSTDGEVLRTPLFIGEDSVFYHFELKDNSGTSSESSEEIDYFLRDNSLIPKPKKTKRYLTLRHFDQKTGLLDFKYEVISDETIEVE